MADQDAIEVRIEKIRKLAHEDAKSQDQYEAAAIAQSVVYDTAGGGHPLMRSLSEAVGSGDWTKVLGACQSVVALFDAKALPSPGLRIAHEIEGDLLDLAAAQAKLAETTTNAIAKQVGLSIAAFLAGAALEDALRRLCDSNARTYDAARTSIAKLQSALYQPTNQIELISSSENKQITTWGDTRNKADHGKFSEITQTEVITMIMGVRAFIDKHLP